MDILKAIALSAIFNPWRCLAFLVLLLSFAVFVACNTYAPQIVVPSPSFWDRFLPLTQLGIAVSLAYLALPYFRHSRMVVERAVEIIGKSHDERDEFRSRLYSRSQSEAGQYRELIGLVKIYELHEAKTGKLRTTIELWRKVRLDESIALNRANARFLNTYYVSADLVVVFLGVLFGLGIHGLALADYTFSMVESHLLTGRIAQALIGITLLAWTCGAPAYFGLRGNELTMALGQFLTKATSQKDHLNARETDETADVVRPYAPKRADHDPSTELSILQEVVTRLAGGQSWDDVWTDIFSRAAVPPSTKRGNGAKDTSAKPSVKPAPAKPASVNKSTPRKPAAKKPTDKGSPPKAG